MKPAKTSIIGLVFFFAAAALALAQGGGGREGGGYGRQMMGDEGYGTGPGMMYGSGYGDCMAEDLDMGPGMMGPGYGRSRGMMPGQAGRYGAHLPPEQRQQLDTARQKFFTETQPLRNQIQEKRFALQEESHRQDPDEAKMEQLQQDLSDLQRQFDQLRLQHQIEVSNIFGADLTQEHLTQITAQRQKFFTETRDLRESIRAKRFQLQEEMSKQEPKAETVLQLQRELSDLKGQFDQKRIQHQLEIRKILPENASGGNIPSR